MNPRHRVKSITALASQSAPRGHAATLFTILVIAAAWTLFAGPAHASEPVTSCGGSGLSSSASCEFVYSGPQLTVTGSREGGCWDLGPLQCVSGIKVTLSSPAGRLLECNASSNLAYMPVACTNATSVPLAPGTILTCAVQQYGTLGVLDYRCTSGVRPLLDDR